MTPPNDPYETRPLPPLTEPLARPLRLPLAAILTLLIVPIVAFGVLLSGRIVPRPDTRLVMLLPSPTLGVAVPTASAGLPHAIVAYAAPNGAVLGALEQGRSYRVVARAGTDWVQIDVAAAGTAPNLVWVAADEIPELAALAQLLDLATPVPTATTHVVHVAATAPAPAPVAVIVPTEPSAAELVPLEPSPTSGYIIPPPTPALRSLVIVTYPTLTPCSIRELGLGLQPCHGYGP